MGRNSRNPSSFEVFSPHSPTKPTPSITGHNICRGVWEKGKWLLVSEWTEGYEHTEVEVCLLATFVPDRVLRVARFNTIREDWEEVKFPRELMYVLDRHADSLFVPMRKD